MNRLLLFFVACLITFVASQRFHQNSSVESNDDIVRFLGDMPLELKVSAVSVPVDMSLNELRLFAQIVYQSPSDESDHKKRSRLLHSSRLSGLLYGNLEWLVRDSAGRIIKCRLPGKSIQNSWRGLEVAETKTGDRTEHRDQLLCTLGESGIPLECVIDSTGERGFRVADLLQTSLNEFHIRQEEISWTSVAYALYLPPQTEWRNRYGEAYNFNDLTSALIERSLHSESCGGTHLVWAQTHILLADRVSAILDQTTRKELKDHLVRRVAQAVDSQLSDGSWPMLWSVEGFRQRPNDLHFTLEGKTESRIIVTGHLLEWFHLLPMDLKPPHSTIASGLNWTKNQLRLVSQSQISENFCPFTHAIRALDLAQTR